MAYPACPSILKTPNFARIAPSHLVIAVGKKRWVKVDKVNALRFQRFKDFEIVTENKLVNGHGRFRGVLRSYPVYHG
jgi:hypothetical protein